MRSSWLLLLLAVTAGCPASTPAPQPPAPAPAPGDGQPTSAGVVDGQIQLARPLEFATGTADLLPSSDELLAPVLGLLNDRPDLTLIRIEGHLAEGNGQDDEIGFSGERAFAVARWLRDHGIACERLLAAAFGTSKPVADGSTAEGRAQNERVTLHVAELRHIAIGGLPTDGGAAAAVDPCP